MTYFARFNKSGKTTLFPDVRMVMPEPKPQNKRSSGGKVAKGLFGTRLIFLFEDRER